MAKKTRRPSRRRFFQRRGRNHSGFKIPIGIVAGLAPLGYDVYNGAKANGFNGMVEAGVYDLSGYSISQKKWDFGQMVKGWTPIIAGYVAHKLAGVFGINAALGRYHVPVIRI